MSGEYNHDENVDHVHNDDDADDGESLVLSVFMKTGFFIIAQ